MVPFVVRDRKRGPSHLWNLTASVLVLSMLLLALVPCGAGASTPAISWSGPTRLQDIGDMKMYVGSGVVDVATDGQGNAYFSWRDGRHTFGAPYARTLFADGTWSMSANADSEGWDNRNEQCVNTAADGRGNVYCAWQKLGSGSDPDRIIVSKSADYGRRFGLDVDVGPSGYGDYRATDIQVGSGNNVHVLLVALRSIQLVTSRDLGTTYQSPVSVAPTLESWQETGAISLAADGAGNVYVGYTMFGFSGGKYLYSAFVAASHDGGTTFGEPVNVTSPHDPSHFELSLIGVAVAPNGTVHCLVTDSFFDEGSNRESHVMLRSSADRGATWTPAAKVDDDAFGSKTVHNFQKLAIGPDGALVVAYMTSLSSTSSTRLRVMSPMGAWSDPVNLDALVTPKGFGFLAGLGVDALHRIHLVGHASESSLGDDLDLYFLGDMRTPPGPVGGFAVSSAKPGVLGLRWSAATVDGGSPVTGYAIYRGVSGGAMAMIATVPATETSYVDGEVKAGRSYSYQVAAVNAMGEGQMAPASGGKAKESKASVTDFDVFWVVFALMFVLMLLVVILATRGGRRRPPAPADAPAPPPAQPTRL